MRGIFVSACAFLAVLCVVVNADCTPPAATGSATETDNCQVKIVASFLGATKKVIEATPKTELATNVATAFTNVKTFAEEGCKMIASAVGHDDHGVEEIGAHLEKVAKATGEVSFWSNPKELIKSVLGKSITVNLVQIITTVAQILPGFRLTLSVKAALESWSKLLEAKLDLYSVGASVDDDEIIIGRDGGVSESDTPRRLKMLEQATKDLSSKPLAEALFKTIAAVATALQVSNVMKNFKRLLKMVGAIYNTFTLITGWSQLCHHLNAQGASFKFSCDVPAGAKDLQTPKTKGGKTCEEFHGPQTKYPLKGVPGKPCSYWTSAFACHTLCKWDKNPEAMGGAGCCLDK